MRKLIALTLAAVLAMTALCGCNILEMGTAPTLHTLVRSLLAVSKSMAAKFSMLFLID